LSQTTIYLLATAHACYTRGDSDVILSAVAFLAMLEVYCVTAVVTS